MKMCPPPEAVIRDNGWMKTWPGRIGQSFHVPFQRDPLACHRFRSIITRMQKKTPMKPEGRPLRIVFRNFQGGLLDPRWNMFVSDLLHARANPDAVEEGVLSPAAESAQAGDGIT